MAGMEGQLIDSAKARGTELLKLNPEYGNWVNGVTEEDADEMLSSERQRGPPSSSARMPVLRMTARIPRFQRRAEYRVRRSFPALMLALVRLAICERWNASDPTNATQR